MHIQYINIIWACVFNCLFVHFYLFRFLFVVWRCSQSGSHTVATTWPTTDHLWYSRWHTLQKFFGTKSMNNLPLKLTLAHITKVFWYKKYEQLATHYERFSTLEVNFFDWPPLIFTLTKAEKKYIKCARRTWSRGSSNWENIERNVEPCYCDGSVALRRLILIELAIQSYILP